MDSKEFKKGKYSVFAFLAMLLGAALMVLLVVSFNTKVKKKEAKVKDPMRYMKMKKQAPPAVKKPKPKRKPKRQKAAPKAPLPNLSSMLGGIEMDIPEFSTGDMMGKAKNILGDVAADAAMSEGTVDTKPRVISRSAMEYPKAASKKRIKGYVIVNLLIGKDGSVEIAKVIASHPAGVFDAVALRGVRSWRFAPAKYRGNPVKVWAKQKVRFDFN